MNQTAFWLACSWFFGVLFFPLAAVATLPLPAGMHDLIADGSKLVYEERFSEAEQMFGQIVKRWPDHPAGYFFQAVVTDARMEFYGIDRDEKKFFGLCDKTVDLGQKLSRSSPANQWGNFFVGGANGYKGTYEARYKRWISAFRNGFEGVNILKKVLDADPSFTDAGMGLGTYYYWRSKLMKTLWWMPGVEDKRTEGIAMLRKTMEKGNYTREVSALSLIRIYIEEKQYADALSIAERMLDQYPHCRAFLWGQGESLFQLKRWAEAEQVYRYILDTVEADELDNHYYSILCHRKLAEIYYQQGIFYKCIAECRRALHAPADEKVKALAGDDLKQIDDILKKAVKRIAR